MRKKVIIFAAKAGGGHVASAIAMKRRLEDAAESVDVEILDHWEILNLGYNTAIYNYCLRHNFIDIYEKAIRPILVCISAITLSHLWLHIPLSRFLRGITQRPNIIVSNSPILNQVIAKAMRRAYGRHAPPLYIVFTDLKDLSHPQMKFAFRPLKDRIRSPSVYYQCCTKEHRQSVLNLGNGPERIVEATGIVIDRSFSAANGSDAWKQDFKKSLGLDPSLPVAYVGFGGYGNSLMLDIIKQSDQLKGKFNFIFVCGRNRTLAEQLRKEIKRGVNAVVFEYVEDPKPYLALSDYFIGKPGTTSVFEALALKLSPLILSTGRIMEQEQATLEYIQDRKLGRFFSDIESLVKFLASENAQVRKALFPGLEDEPENNGVEVAAENILRLADA